MRTLTGWMSLKITRDILEGILSKMLPRVAHVVAERLLRSGYLALKT